MLVERECAFKCQLHNQHPVGLGFVRLVRLGTLVKHVTPTASRRGPLQTAHLQQLHILGAVVVHSTAMSVNNLFQRFCCHADMRQRGQKLS